MADDPEIPAHLIALQRAYDQAHAAVVVASRQDPPAEQEKLDRLRGEERAAVMALHRARQGTEWAAWEQQQRVQAAARQ